MIGIKKLRENKEEIILHYKKGKSTYFLAKEYNTYPQQINIILKESNVPLRTPYQINNIPINENLMNHINGWMLGDGHVTKSKKQSSFCISSKHQEYIKYINNIFINNNMSCKIYTAKQFNKIYYKLTTLSSVQIKNIRNIWYKNNTKIIPKKIKLTPTVLNHWMMDDGTYNADKGHIRLCTNCFSIDECIFLANKLNNLLDVNDIHIIEKGINKTRIYLPKNSANKFLNFAGKCNVNCFNYKWGN